MFAILVSLTLLGAAAQVQLVRDAHHTAVRADDPAGGRDQVGRESRGYRPKGVPRPAR